MEVVVVEVVATRGDRRDIKIGRQYEEHGSNGSRQVRQWCAWISFSRKRKAFARSRVRGGTFDQVSSRDANLISPATLVGYS